MPRTADGGGCRFPTGSCPPAADRADRIMFTTTLSDRELETLILALKYWRGRRHGVTRRGDRVLTRLELDLLLAKLGAGTLSSLPADDPEDAFHT